MSKVESAALALLRSGERPQHVLKGLSDGLNRGQRNATDATVLIADSAVIVSWLKGMIPKPVAERFEYSEILGAYESDDPLPGVAGALERKNATHALARAMGSSSTRPTLIISTRRGILRCFSKARSAEISDSRLWPSVT